MCTVQAPKQLNAAIRSLLMQCWACSAQLSTALAARIQNAEAALESQEHETTVSKSIADDRDAINVTARAFLSRLCHDFDSVAFVQTAKLLEMSRNLEELTSSHSSFRTQFEALSDRLDSLERGDSMPTDVMKAVDDARQEALDVKSALSQSIDKLSRAVQLLQTERHQSELGAALVKLERQ